MPKLFLSLILMSTLSSSFSQPLHLSSGTIRRFENFPSAYVAARTIDVWLPDGFSPGKKYAVLYMHDGQMLFDSSSTWNHQSWEVDQTLGLLLAQKKIRDCIVVGIWNNGKARHSEYFPQKAIPLINDLGQKELLPMLESDPKADRYLQFLVTEVKPFIDSAFPTRRDRQNTFIMGSSMGALISLYAICEYPDVFGGAGCLSTHWTGIYRKENNPVPGAILRYLKSSLPSPKTHKIYFDHGTQTLDSLYSDFQKQVDQIMKSKGYTSKNWETKTFPGEDHSENAWRRRLSIPVLFLLRR